MRALRLGDIVAVVAGEYAGRLGIVELYDRTHVQISTVIDDEDVVLILHRSEVGKPR